MNADIVALITYLMRDQVEVLDTRMEAQQAFFHAELDAQFQVMGTGLYVLVATLDLVSTLACHSHQENVAPEPALFKVERSPFPILLVE